MGLVLFRITFLTLCACVVVGSAPSVGSVRESENEGARVFVCSGGMIKEFRAGAGAGAGAGAV